MEGRGKWWPWGLWWRIDWGTGLRGEVMDPGWGGQSLRNQNIHRRCLQACSEHRRRVFHRILNSKLVLKISLLDHVYALISRLKLWKWLKSSGKLKEEMKTRELCPYVQRLGCAQVLLIQRHLYYHSMISDWIMPFNYILFFISILLLRCLVAFFYIKYWLHNHIDTHTILGFSREIDQ